MEIREEEKRRAMNQVWNGAGDYGFEADFCVYQKDGEADLYWNTMVGVLRKHFDWERLMEAYGTLRGNPLEQEEESLFWLFAEHQAFLREAASRPVLESLRRSFAHALLDAPEEEAEESRARRILKAHFAHVLGRSAELPGEDLALLEALECEAADTDAFVARILEVLAAERKARQGKHRFFGIPLLPVLPFLPDGAFRTSKLPPVRRLAMGFGEHEREYVPQILDSERKTDSFAGAVVMTKEARRAYIGTIFGRSLLAEEESERWEKRLCTGNHREVRLYFTDGVPMEAPAAESPSVRYALRARKEGEAQAERNRAFYAAGEKRYSQMARDLARRLQNASLLLTDDEERLSVQGKLDGRRVPRAVFLGESRVWTKVLPGEEPDLGVDVLLDGSGSQTERAPLVAAQAVILARALGMAGIPVRVTSFCSQSGYTVFRLLKDFDGKETDGIFRFFTTGANRDGLAVRVMREWKRPGDGGRLLVILTDALPVDGVRIRTVSGSYRDYAEENGVMDAAEEVHRARLSGLPVLAIVGGSEKSTVNARSIYGTGFARIKSDAVFAETVGKLLLRELAELDRR